MLDKLQKRIYRTVGTSLATSLEPLAQCQNVASLSLVFSIGTTIFPSTFRQLVKSSKNSVWIELWNSICSCIFFFFFLLGKPLKDFPFYSPILLILWFRYLQTCLNRSCMPLSSQLFKTSSKISKKKMHFTVIYRHKFPKFSFWCPPWGHPMKPLN